MLSENPTVTSPAIETRTPEAREAREALAQRVLAAFTAAFAKLAEHKDDIAALWVEFENLSTGDTIMGCRTKTEFCEKVLGRSIRAVQYLLNGRTEPKSVPPVPEANNVRVPTSVEPVSEPEPVVDVKEPESVPASTVEDDECVPNDPRPLIEAINELERTFPGVTEQIRKYAIPDKNGKITLQGFDPGFSSAPVSEPVVDVKPESLPVSPVGPVEPATGVTACVGLIEHRTGLVETFMTWTTDPEDDSAMLGEFRSCYRGDEVSRELYGKPNIAINKDNRAHHYAAALALLRERLAMMGCLNSVTVAALEKEERKYNPTPIPTHAARTAKKTYCGKELPDISVMIAANPSCPKCKTSAPVVESEPESVPALDPVAARKRLRAANRTMVPLQRQMEDTLAMNETATPDFQAKYDAASEELNAALAATEPVVEPTPEPEVDSEKMFIVKKHSIHRANAFIPLKTPRYFQGENLDSIWKLEWRMITDKSQATRFATEQETKDIIKMLTCSCTVGNRAMWSTQLAVEEVEPAS